MSASGLGIKPGIKPGKKNECVLAQLIQLAKNGNVSHQRVYTESKVLL